jgi:hypothetical protein
MAGNIACRLGAGGLTLDWAAGAQLSVPANGSKVNRALFTTDAAQRLVSLVELYDVSTADVGRTYTGDELVSFNVFGLHPAHLAVFDTCRARFLAALEAERAGAAPPPPPATGTGKDYTARELILADAVNSLAPLGNVCARRLFFCGGGPCAPSPSGAAH